MTSEPPESDRKNERGHTGRSGGGHDPLAEGPTGGVDGPSGGGEATTCLLVVDEAGRVRSADPAVERLFGYAPESVVGAPLERLLPPERQPAPERYRNAAVAPAWTDAEVYGERRDGEQVALRAATTELAGDDAALALTLRPAGTDFPAGSATRSRLAEGLRRVLRAVVAASSREELERAVCERLTDVEPYAFAWIGERNHEAGRIEPRETAGDGEAYLDGIDPRVDGDARPVQRTVQAGEVATVRDLAGEESGPWAERAVESGFESAASVPLCHDGTTYGVLAVYADRPDAFGPGDRRILADLGDVVGLGITAIERQRALIADGITQAEFAITADHPVLAVTEGGPTLYLEGVVPTAADECVFYYTVEGGDPEAVLDRIVGGADRTRSGRVVAEGDQPLVKWIRDDPTISTVLTEFGGSEVEQVIADGTIYVTAELPRGADVRSVHDALQEAVDGIDGDVELIAQRPAPRTPSTRRFGAEVVEQLSDRQLSALRSAYFAGYHDRPRTSTGEEIAEDLGVSPSTFHQHHRVGVRKLLAAAFDRPDRTE